MNNAETLIKKINTSKKVEEVLNIKDFDKEYTEILKVIHPDKCNASGSDEATQKMNGWKDYFKVGKEYKDDIGTFKTNGYWARFYSDSEALQWSLENWEMLHKLPGTDTSFFSQYTPLSYSSETGYKEIDFNHRSIPISGLTLPQEHVNWILNRLLEYITYLAQKGFTHCGLNPESIFIVPETHGIQIVSFYHLSKLGSKVGTVSGKYANWYPQSLFTDKIATQAVDIELAKKIAIYLLGDKSGSGTSLRKTVNAEYLDFLLTHHDNCFDALTAYKAMLAKNFEKKFYSLDI